MRAVATAAATLKNIKNWHSTLVNLDIYIRQFAACIIDSYIDIIDYNHLRCLELLSINYCLSPV